MQRLPNRQSPSQIPPRSSPGRKKPEDDLKAARRQFWVSISLAAVAVIIVIIILMKLMGVEIFTSTEPAVVADTPTPSDQRLLEFDGSRKSSSAAPMEQRKILILSDVEGTEIWLNDTFYGLTPLEIKDPAPGTYNGLAKIMNPPKKKNFTIKVAPSPPKTYTHKLVFMGGAVQPLAPPTPTPKPRDSGIKVIYPDSAKYGKYFRVIVRPKPGLQINGGFLKLMSSCKQDKLRLQDAPSLDMVPYQGGVIRENLRPERCPGQRGKNQGLFYIILSTNRGTITLGSPQNPYVIEYTR